VGERPLAGLSALELAECQHLALVMECEQPEEAGSQPTVY
jgi:hypothetical protein